MIAETMNRWTKNRPAVPGNYWMLSNAQGLRIFIEAKH